MSKNQNFRPVRTTDRTLDMLELLAERAEGLSFSDIAVRLSLPKSSLSGLLRTLTARRYVARTNDGRRFRLGSKVLDLSVSYLHDGSQLEAAEQAMRRLAREVGEAAHVAVLDAADVIYVAVESSLHSMRISSPLGRRLPAHATAVGKSLLATLSDDEIDRRLGAELSQRTPRTITSLSVLKREITQIRRFGYAYDAEEFAAGLHCVAAPVLDENGRAIASIGVSIPRARLEEVEITRIPSAVLAAAKEVSRTALPSAGMMLWRPRRVKVAWSMASIHVQAYQIIYHTVEKISARMKTDVIWADAKDDAVKQTVDVASLLAMKPDVILITIRFMRSESGATLCPGRGVACAGRHLSASGEKPQSRILCRRRHLSSKAL
ncbi:MAG: IclR family transcriptional regulator C-terminal domain-containing protein [Pyrinomonadaceae bacterium]